MAGPEVKQSQEVAPKQDTAESILRQISEKKFPVESFNEQLSKEFKKEANSNKLYEAIKTSLTPELISTLDSKAVISAQKLLTWIKENLKSSTTGDNLKSIDSLLVYITQRIDKIAVDQKNEKQETDKKNTSILTSLESTETPLSFFAGGVSEFSAFLDANPSYLNEANLSKLMNNLGLPSLSPQDRNTYAELILNKVLVSPSLLSQYVGYIKPDSLRYLGSDAETQIKLYNLLLSSPLCKTLAVEGSQIEANLLAVRLAITTKNTVSLNDQMKDLSRQTKEKVEDFFTQFGSAILSIANFLGGKNALKKFFLKFNVNLDANINDLYKNTYEVDSAKLKDIYDDSFDFQSASPKEIPSRIEQYYSGTRLDSNFISLDPSLVDRANQASLQIPDLVISDGSLYGEQKYKINPSVLTSLQLSDKQKIISQIFKDPTLRQNINKLQDPLTSASLYGKENPKKDQDWYAKCPDFKNPKELSVVVGAYLMKGSKDIKYVLSESHLPYEEIHKQEWDAKNKKTEGSPDLVKDGLKKDWNTLFADLDTTGKRKSYPLTLDAQNKLNPQEKTAYTEYTKTISDKITNLVNPNLQDLSFLFEDVSLKEKITPFLTKHFTTYLNSLKDTPIYIDPNKTVINSVISKLTTITSGLSISLSDKGELSITGKDSTKPTPKDIKIESTEFSWFPKKIPA